MTFRVRRKLQFSSAIVTSFSVFGLWAMAQNTVPMDATGWILSGDMTFETHDGRTALNMNRGSATLNAPDISRGIYNFDMWFEDKRQFPGFAFRGVDDTNFESFYFRPHQSGNPDATQYTPVYNGLSAWQIYTGEGFSNAIEIKKETWVPVRLEVYEDSAQIFYNGKSALYIPDLIREEGDGYFRFRSSRPGAFVSNFSYSSIPNLVDPGPPTDTSEGDAAPDQSLDVEKWQYVTDWSLSPAMTDVEAIDRAKAADWTDITWKQPGVEYNNFTNISKVAELTDDHTSVIARFTLESESERAQALEFGFSDAVKVFVNRRQIYAGSDLFRSRDYRFLGTVGFHDTVILPLQKGENDIVFVVSENFGGWAVGARMAKD